MSIDYLKAGLSPRIHQPAISAVVLVVRSALKAFGNYLERRQRIRSDRIQLMSKPDHMLKDIGIKRSEIDFVVNHGREINRIREIGRLPG